MGHLLCYFAQLSTDTVAKGYIWLTHTWIVDMFLSYCSIFLVIHCLLHNSFTLSSSGLNRVKVEKEPHIFS